MNLTNQEIPQHHLVTKFGPNNKKPPFMDIVNATEICALSLEKENQTENAELLRKIIKKLASLFRKT